MVRKWQWVVRGREGQQKGEAGVLGSIKEALPEVARQACGKEAYLTKGVVEA